MRTKFASFRENMEVAVTMLYRDDRPSKGHDGLRMGPNGRWQANLHDPEGKRTELMKFQSVRPRRSAYPMR